MAPPSLGALARKTALSNIDELTYVSTLPYNKVQRLLRNVRNDYQLKEIEENSPQIKEHDDELWEAFTKKKFSVQLKKMKRLNGGLDLKITSWRDLYWQLRKEDDEREAQALAHLQKTYTTWNKTKDDHKANLADPRRLPKRPKDASTPNYSALHNTPDRYYSKGKKSLVEKAWKEADKVVTNRENAVRARLAPKKALPVAPRGLTEALRRRAQPKIPMRSDKDMDTTDIDRMEREAEERAKREERLLAAKKPKQAVKDDGILMPGTSIPRGLQTILDTPGKPAAPITLPKTASSPVKKSSGGLLSCPAGLQKTHSRVKTGASSVPKPSSSSPTNGVKARPSSSHGFSASTSSTTETESDDDLFGDKQTSKTGSMAPGFPTKRRLSMVDGSADDADATGPAGLPPRKKAKTVTGIFMPTKRAR